VNQLGAQGAVRLAVFEYRKGLTYRLHYENPRAKSTDNATLNLNTNIETIASIASEIKLGQEQRGLPAPLVTAASKPEEGQPSSFRKIAGITLLLVGLLLLFGMMLKARSQRRMNVRVGSRTFTTRL
jgi:hypothetical protein